MADPGFPVGGGVDLVGGGVDSRGGYVSKILYVKTKELGSLGGAHAGRAPPRSANGYCYKQKYNINIKFTLPICFINNKLPLNFCISLPCITLQITYISFQIIKRLGTNYADIMRMNVYLRFAIHLTNFM